MTAIENPPTLWLSIAVMRLTGSHIFFVGGTREQAVRMRELESEPRSEVQAYIRDDVSQGAYDIARAVAEGRENKLRLERDALALDLKEERERSALLLGDALEAKRQRREKIDEIDALETRANLMWDALADIAKTSSDPSTRIMARKALDENQLVKNAAAAAKAKAATP